MSDVQVAELPSFELFRERMRFALARAHLKPAELAELVGTSPQNVQNMISRGRKRYQGNKLLELAAALKVPAGWLAYNTGGDILPLPSNPEGQLALYPAAFAATGADKPAKRRKTTGNQTVLNIQSLSALQVAGLEALASLMRSGEFSDEEVIDLLGELKPRLARRAAATESA